jgi:hypothetical protein
MLQPKQFKVFLVAPRAPARYPSTVSLTPKQQQHNMKTLKVKTLWGKKKGKTEALEIERVHTELWTIPCVSSPFCWSLL